MRDIALFLATAAYLPMALMNPAAGTLCWVWYSLMSPHKQVYSFASAFALNSLVAGATLLAWLLSKERKVWTPDFMPWLLLIFTCWMTISSFFAPFPDWSWTYWNLTMHMLVMAFLLFFVARTKARIQGVVWAVVIGIGFYGVKGGIFTIATGGNYIVLGPAGTILGDNNQLAAAVVMTIPLVNYLRLQTKNRWMQIGLAGAMVLEVFMVLGSHSRGGVIALSASLLVFWLSMRRKLAYGVAGGLVVGVALYFMPAVFWQRMDTLHNVDADASFQGRLNAWYVATRVATDHFPFGAGFYGPQLPAVWNNYLPGINDHAAHSIYFQVLGEHGFIGLAIYLLILVVALYNAHLVVRRSRNRPDLAWASDLGKMMRVALIGFYVGGAALSMAYFDGLFVLIALASTLRELVTRQVTPAAAALPTMSWRSRVQPVRVASPAFQGAIGSGAGNRAGSGPGTRPGGGAGNRPGVGRVTNRGS